VFIKDVYYSEPGSPFDPESHAMTSLEVKGGYVHYHTPKMCLDIAVDIGATPTTRKVLKMKGNES
jgi:hypothetical protein